MFKCDYCGKSSKPGEPVKLVYQSEPTVHPKRTDRQDRVIDNGGNGTRIVSQRKRCSRCAE